MLLKIKRNGLKIIYISLILINNETNEVLVTGSKNEQDYTLTTGQIRVEIL